MPQRLEFIENEAFVLTATVRRRGTGAAVDLDAYDTVTLQIHDRQVAFGTNQLSVAGTPDPDQTTNRGVVTFSLSSSNTALATGKTDFSGHWSIQCKTNDNSLNERTYMGECVILRNPFVVV